MHIVPVGTLINSLLPVHIIKVQIPFNKFPSQYSLHLTIKKPQTFFGLLYDAIPN